MADYVTTEPAFDFERGDFVIINGRPKMVVGMDRLRSWIGKVLRTQKGRYKICLLYTSPSPRDCS